MPEFTVNPTRFDPYKNFKFRVKWDGKYVAGISRISELRRSTEVVEHREGGDPSQARKSPGRTTYDPITLERGVTQDTAFEAWANLVWKLNAAQGSEVALADFRKDIVLEFYNEAGQLVLAYNIYRYLSLLGVGIRRSARARSGWWFIDRDTVHQAGKRRLGARSGRRGAERAHWLITDASSANEGHDTFQPSRPKELVDRGCACHLVSRLPQHPRVTRQRRGIATHVDHHSRFRRRDRWHLRRGACERRVQHHRCAAGQLRRRQRLAGKIALRRAKPS